MVYTQYTYVHMNPMKGKNPGNPRTVVKSGIWWMVKTVLIDRQQWGNGEMHRIMELGEWIDKGRTAR